jgi:hypothetical protein
MYTNTYFAEKLTNAHRYDLLAEVARRQVLANLPRNHQQVGRRAIGKLGSLLVRLGMWLEQSAQRSERMAIDV